MADTDSAARDRVQAMAAEYAPDGLLVADAQGTIVSANARMSAMVGVSEGALIGTAVDALVPPDARSAHASHRDAFVATSQARPMGRGAALSLVTAAGELIPVEVALSTVEDGAARLVVAVVRDVRDRLDAERRERAVSEQLALADERERIARDLHDTVLQRLYGLGLELQATALRVEAPVSQRLDGAVDEIDRIISEIRATVFTLGSARREGSFGQQLGTLLLQASRLIGHAPRLRVDGPLEALLSTPIRTELLSSLREALSNVARHAESSQVDVEVAVVDSSVRMTVRDNGRGLGGLQTTPGNGISNMQARAASMGGSCTITEADPHGCIVTWTAPLEDQGPG